MGEKKKKKSHVEESYRAEGELFVIVVSRRSLAGPRRRYQLSRKMRSDGSEGSGELIDAPAVDGASLTPSRAIRFWTQICIYLFISCSSSFTENG